MVFAFEKTVIPDIVIIKPNVIKDSRGSFIETYKESEFRAHGITCQFHQENASISNKDVLRGLHYQLEPFEQGKLVSVSKGRVFDVAVDIRKESKYFQKWIGVELSGENKKMLWIPPGFAHGFLSLEDGSTVIYKVTNEYNKESERGVAWNDPDINVKWPAVSPILSEKDSKHPFLRDAEVNFHC